MAVRRSIWGKISLSKKVNALSDKALILYVLTISHLDDQGFIDADPRILKSTIVPLRDNIGVRDIEDLIKEISTIHEKVESNPTPLWKLHKTTQGIFIEDPYFNEHQSFKGIRRKDSKIKYVVYMETNGCQIGDEWETEGRKIDAQGKGEGEGKGEGKGKGEGEVETENKRVTHTPEELRILFNSITQYLPKATELGKGRKDKIKTRFKEGKTFEWWETVFRKADIILIPGKDGKKDWFPNFDWLIENDKNAVKVFEGNYDDAKRPQSIGKSIDAANIWLEVKEKQEKANEERRQKEIQYSIHKNES